MSTTRRVALFCLLATSLLVLAAVRWLGPVLAEDLLIQRQYAAAVVALEELLPAAPSADRDRILFLLGKAQLLCGRPKDAVASFGRLTTELPGSGLLSAARFQQAKALEAQGDVRGAAQVYRDCIERLIGLDRKNELAATYLGLADKAQAKEPPDHARVVLFSDLALDLGLKPEAASMVRLHAAMALQALGKHPEAIGRMVPLTLQLDVANGKLAAMLALGRSRRATNDLAGARTVLRDLRTLAPKSPEGGDAAYEVALCYGVPAPVPSQLERAVGALQQFEQQYPEHPNAKLAQFLVAQCYRNVGRGDDAFAALQRFLATRADSGINEVALARAMLGDVLHAQNKSEAAIVAWREYLQKHPSHGEWERVQRAIVDTEYAMAFAAYVAGKTKFDTARDLFQKFERDYPLDPRNPDVLWLLGDMLRQEEKYDEARAAFARCVSKYPGRDKSSAAQFAIGEIFEQKAFDYEQALHAFRAVTFGPMQGEAANRIQRLLQKHLHLHTDRVFRTDEAPVFELTSRNIETVRVRIYRLDLQDYFRATQTVGDVSRLDIEVIAPDQITDSAVKDYVRYRETKREVALPFREPGAYIIKVDDRELEATTLVLISDLALIAKSSRHEFFVFTQNCKENRPEAGVKVLLSDGQKVIAEGLTGSDGAYRFRGDDLKNRDQLSVFAIAAGGSCASSIDLSGMGYSVGLLQKGYLFTDRPLYQPGQRVQWKGIVREVKDFVYQLPQAQGYRVQLWSPSGRVLLQQKVAFTAFGSFASECDLPTEAEPGEWRIGVDVEGRTEPVAQCTFLVGKYERPRLSLRAELSEPVVYRGEEIRGRFLASWFYGEPAAGKEVRYRLSLPEGGTIERTGVTNAAGELEFVFPTTEFAEEALAPLTAELVAESVTTSVVVPIVTTEFTPVLKASRSVYLAKETFEILVQLTDPSGKPLLRELTLTLAKLEQGKARGELVEREVARKPAATDKGGKAKVSFAADVGGQYRVRAFCADRFGNPVSGEMLLTISGDDDQTRLRLLSDRSTYQVGETATLKVMNRAGKKLALLTWQGDGILSYETRLLPAGESLLELAVRAEHAPNFALGIAMIDGNRLHTQDCPFRVLRDLHIELKVPAAAKPGASIEVGITARDSQGKPVVAEVALLIVDQSLLAQSGDNAPSIGGFFYGDVRETNFRTSSSCTWAYDAKSRRVNAALLAEERQRLGDTTRDGDSNAPDESARQPGRDAPRPQAAAPVIGNAGGMPAASSPQSLPAIAGLQGGGSDGAAGRFGLQQQAGEPANEFAKPDANVALLRNQLNLHDGLGAGSNLGEQEQTIEFRRNLGLAETITANDGKDGSLPNGSLKFARRFASADQSEKAGYLNQHRAFSDSAELFFDAGAAALLRVDFRETGAWLPAIVTAADGQGVAKVTMPQLNTGWSVTARAVTADTSVGEAFGSLQTQQDLQVDIVSPRVLTEGDTTEITVRVHNLTTAALDGKVLLRMPAVATQQDQTALVKLNAHGEGAASFPLTAHTEPVEIEASVIAGAHSDRMKVVLPVLPFGAEVVDGRSGSTRDQATFELGLAEEREYSALRMMVELGPDPGRDLVSAALGTGYLPRSCMQVADTNLARSSKGLGALVVLDHLERCSLGTKADHARLLGTAQGLLQTLLASQLTDGSVAWVGNKLPDLRSTCQFVRFLAAARRRGLLLVEEPQSRAVEWLLQGLSKAGAEQRADMLWALASADRARFEVLNSTHRARIGLSVDGLARLALAWHEVKRPELALEVIDSLRSVLPQAVTGNTTNETLALAARALLLTDKRDALGTKLLSQVEQLRRGSSYGTSEATTAALQLLALARGSDAGPVRATEVVVLVNGEKLATQPRTAGATETSFVVPVEWLKPRGNKIQISVAGGGEAFYSVSLIGFARGFRDADRNTGLINVERSYRATPRRFGDQIVPSGFDVIVGKNIPTFVNTITQLQAGESAMVQISFAVRLDADKARMLPLIVEEPIPAGCSVSRASIRGDFEQVDVLADRLLFFVRDSLSSGVFSYELQARFAGSYRALPLRCYSALRPELLASGQVSTLTIHAPGKGEVDRYTLTPSELFFLGKAQDDAAQKLSGEARQAALALAAEHFDRLLTDWQKPDYQLRDDVAKEVVRRMLFLAIERGDSKAVVRFFEAVKERYADLVVPFDKILVVGKSYLDLGEFESALLVFRGTAEASFLKDAGVATTLEGLGEIKASANFLDRLLMAYPDLPTMRVARYSIGQKLAAVAAAMDPALPIDEKVGKAADLRARSLATFREFLVLHPEDPLAEEVSFAWVTTQLEAKDLKAAQAIAEAALLRYPQSPFVDELLYTLGYAQFALGQHDLAFVQLQRVATEQFATDKGGRAESENKWNAIYLQGQIHHARGEPALALVDYERVKDRFSDASEASDYFLQKQLSLPEVSTFALSQVPKLDLTFRNVAKVSLQVFQVDLMRLYLLEKSLNDIAGVQLHGIKPLLVKELVLGDGSDYRSKVRQIDLELKEPGAYLAVVRGGDQVASGMLLRSDLKIEAQEQADVGRLRVNVKQGEAVLAAAEVKVTGSGFDSVRSGETDLRGIYVGDGLVGKATVVVKKDQQYAFFRGTAIHQPERMAPKPAKTAQAQAGKQTDSSKKLQNFDAINQNVFSNSQNRDRQVQWLNDNVSKKKQVGVEVYRAK